MLKAIIAATALLTACTFSDSDERREESTSQGAQQAQPAPPPRPTMRIEVNLAQRQLHVYDNDQLVATHGVAVGSKEWPTPAGEWTVSQVIFNPRWVPPTEESWYDSRHQQTRVDRPGRLARLDSRNQRSRRRARETDHEGGRRLEG